MRTKSTLRRYWHWILLGLLVWAGLAYLLAPLVWHQIERGEDALLTGPRLTETPDGHPGDPVNIALLGVEEQVVRAMTAAGWCPADPITFATSVRIVVDAVVQRPDGRAPVSNLYLFGRKEDLAFELPVGNSPRRRHHVRFWKWDRLHQGKVVWFGSASFDERVGLSYTTGEVTHHIGPDVDAERGLIMRGLEQAGWAAREYFIADFHPHLEGHNGGGDLWRTDGRLGVVDLRALRSNYDRLEANARRERVGAWGDSADIPTMELPDGNGSESRDQESQPDEQPIGVMPDITDLMPSAVDIIGNDGAAEP